MKEDFFKYTQSTRSKARTPKVIPSNNPYKYQDYVVPILESLKVLKSGVITFTCRSTHEIKPPILMEHENDVLYQIFAELSGQYVKFMRIWLDMFVRMHKKSFE